MSDTQRQAEGAADPADRQRCQPPVLGRLPARTSYWCSAAVIAARLRYPASIVCPECLSRDAEWTAVSGRGKVFSFVVFHRAYHPAWEGKVPYNVALIELDEGPIMLSNVVDVDNAKLAVGQPVRVAFEKLDDDLAIPVFKPADD